MRVLACVHVNRNMCLLRFIKITLQRPFMVLPLFMGCCIAFLHRNNNNINLVSLQLKNAYKTESTPKAVPSLLSRV